MFVLNDVTKDARVLKEAGSLVAAGHDVTIMGLWPAGSALPEREQRPEGFTIIRTPYPVGREWWRPNPQFLGLALRRLRALPGRLRYRAARRRRLLHGTIRRSRARLVRRRRLVASTLRRWRYLTARRSRLAAAGARRLRYRAWRRRRLTVAGARRLRYRFRRRRLLLRAAARKRRGGTAALQLELVLAGLGITPPRTWPGAIARLRRVRRLRGRPRRRRAPIGRRRLSIRRGRVRRRGAIARHRVRAAVGRRTSRPALTRHAGRTRRVAGRTARAATALIRRAGRLLMPFAKAIYFLWACTYVAVNVLTSGHLDWLLRLRYRWDGWGRAAAARAPLADVWHAHDLSGLFGAMRARERNGAPVVYDSHEIMLESSGFALRPRWMRWSLARLERRWAAQATALVTVNGMLARELGDRLAPRRTVVVYNCPPTPRANPESPVDRLRTAAGIPADAPVALYHGGLMLHRGCEQLAQALLEPGLEHVHGVLLGYGGQRDAFVELASDPVFGGRLHVLDAVPPDELLGWVASADVAVMPIQASTLNHRMSTPNKLFEAIGAGVPVVGSDFEGFRDVVYANPNGPLGRLCDPHDVSAIGRSIREILGLSAEARRDMKRRCVEAARRRWNWEHEVRGLVALYDDLARLGDPAGTAAGSARA